MHLEPEVFLVLCTISVDARGFDTTLAAGIGRRRAPR